MTFNNKLKNHKAFTLIELLVVIAIIGLLSSVVLASLNSARQKARVAWRVSNLTQLRSALELYYSDNNSYPNPGWGWRSECVAWGSLAPAQIAAGASGFPDLTPKYISVFPSDPSMDKAGDKNCFLYLSNGTDYKLMDYTLTDMTQADVDKFTVFKDLHPYSLTLSICSPGGCAW